MRRLLAPIALLAVLPFAAGCGDDSGGAGTDDEPTSGATSASSSDPADEAVDFELEQLVSGTGGGGSPSETAAPVEDPDDLAAFVADLSPDLAGDVEDAVEESPPGEGEQLFAAVVSVSCDVPPGVEVTRVADGYAVQAQEVADPLPECEAPVTTVALLAIAVDAPGGETDGEPTDDPSEASGTAEVVELIHETAVGGQVSERLVPVDDPSEVAAFIRQFGRPTFAATITDSVHRAAEAGDDATLYAAVIGLGCDVPTGAEITPTDDGYRIQADKIPDPIPECLAPVTTVAIVSVAD